MMATNETFENQTHEAGDESYSNKFTNTRNNHRSDQMGDADQLHDGRPEQRSNNCIEKGLECMNEVSNGQSTINSMDQSTDTLNTTTTSTSTPNSPQQITHEQDKQDQTYEKSIKDSANDSNTNLDTSNVNSTRAVGETDHDGDDEDEGDDLEEGELKDDDDDDDDDDDNDDDNINNASNNMSANDNNQAKNSSAYSDSKLNDHNSQNNFSNYGGSNRQYNHNNRRHFSPNQPHHPGMHHAQFPPYQQQFPGNAGNNYRFPPGHDGGMPPVMLPQMNHPQAGDIYGPRGGPINAGPVQKVNIKCRYYSKTSNKCTWGEQCRFRHREDSPSMSEGPFEDQRPPPGPADMAPMPARGPQPMPMGGAERFYPAPSMPPQSYGYGPVYEHHPPYGPHQSASPPLPPYPVPPHHWRQQHSPYPPPSSSSAQHPESVSPAMLPNPAGGAPPMALNSSGRVPPPQTIGGSTANAAPVTLSPGGGSSPGFSSSPSSSAVYERKYRLAYEAAPWNERGYPPPSRYDRNDPANYPPSSRGGYYRNHYSRDPYGREPIPPHHHMGGGSPYNYPSGYPPNYPSSYRGAPPSGGAPYASHHRYPSSSQRTVPSDSRQSKSNKRARDGESSWSDSGSEDSLLNQAGTSSRNHSSKISKKHHRTSALASEDPDTDISAAASKNDVDQGGSGTPPGEPLPEEKERQELLLEKLREIEDLMAKKKEEDSQ